MEESKSAIENRGRNKVKEEDSKSAIESRSRNKEKEEENKSAAQSRSRNKEEQSENIRKEPSGMTLNYHKALPEGKLKSSIRNLGGLRDFPPPPPTYQVEVKRKGESPL